MNLQFHLVPKSYGKELSISERKAEVWRILRTSYGFWIYVFTISMVVSVVLPRLRTALFAILEIHDRYILALYLLSMWCFFVLGGYGLALVVSHNMGREAQKKIQEKNEGHE